LNFVKVGVNPALRRLRSSLDECAIFAA
jgi:hypothetical protein